MDRPRMFRHFKGGIYEWIADAQHTEINEPLTIYKNWHGKVFARPSSMFYGATENGTKRFVETHERNPPMPSNEPQAPAPSAPDAALDADTAALLEAVAKMTPGRLKGGYHFIALAFGEDEDWASFDAMQEAARANSLGIQELSEHAPDLLRRWQERAASLEDNTAIGESLVAAIKQHQPGYHWNESPTEIVLDLMNDVDAWQERAKKAEGEAERLHHLLEHVHALASDAPEPKLMPGNDDAVRELIRTMQQIVEALEARP